ncbi:MAG: hypothetical protein ACOY31_06995 [Bacillota bacterium]
MVVTKIFRTTEDGDERIERALAEFLLPRHVEMYWTAHSGPGAARDGENVDPVKKKGIRLSANAESPRTPFI